MAFAYELAANTSQTSVAYTKALLWRGGDSLEEQHLLDSRVLSELARGKDAEEGARAFRERREPRFEAALGKDMGVWYPWVSTKTKLLWLWDADCILLVQWRELDVKHRKAKL